MDETKRDLQADLALCDAATPGPWESMPSIHAEFPFEICCNGFLDPIVASAIDEADARFIAEARTGWPHAIRRALAAEAELQRVVDISRDNIELLRQEKAHMAERIAELEAEVERLRAALKRIANEEFPQADVIPVEMFYELQLIARQVLREVTANGET
jgi:uncharacterized small protein (DUF1192 family)